jgi:hypothetical protein
MRAKNKDMGNALLTLLLISFVHEAIFQTTQNINVCAYKTFNYCLGLKEHQVEVMFFVVLINEENNALSERAFEVAKEYVRRNPGLGLAVDPVIVVGNRTDAKAFLENGKTINH